MSKFTVMQTFHIPAKTGKGFEVTRGEFIRRTDLQGAQPVDFWAFNKTDIYEYLSCEHTRPSIEKLFPHVGHAAYTNHRRPVFFAFSGYSSRLKFCQTSTAKILDRARRSVCEFVGRTECDKLTFGPIRRRLLF